MWINMIGRLLCFVQHSLSPTAFRVSPVFRWGSSYTVQQTYAMEDNSPVHDGVQSPFWVEDQTSPDQLQNGEKCKQEIKFNKAQTDKWSIFLATWYRYRFVFLPGNSQLISDSVFPSLVLLLVERIRWGTETGDCQQRERHTNTDTQGQTAVCVVDHWTNIMPLLFPIRKNKVSQTDSGDMQARKTHRWC